MEGGTPGQLFGNIRDPGVAGTEKHGWADLAAGLGTAISQSGSTTTISAEASEIDHTALLNIGTNSHDVVDAHIAAANPHSGSANTDHDATHVTGGGDKIRDATAAVDGLMTAAYGAKLDGIEAGADVTDAANVDAAGAVMESDFNEDTILAADSDNTPAPLTVSQHQVVANVSGNIGVVSIADLEVLGRSGGNLAGLARAALNMILSPTRSLILTAAGGHGTMTSGAGDVNGLPEQAETATNKINYWYLGFGLGDKAFWAVQMPDSYVSSGTFQGYFVWTSANGSAGHECKFQIKGRAFANDDAFDQACGTARSPGDDVLLAQGDLHISPILSTALSLAGSPAGGQYAYFEVERVAVDDGTEISGDVRLLQVRLEFGTSDNSD
jgi:hypothetical protein